jgi:hypothetical protein
MAREDIQGETKRRICFENPKRMYPLVFQQQVPQPQTSAGVKKK